MPIPLIIPGARATEIIQERVKAALANWDERISNVIPDGIFPGTTQLTGQERLLHYLTVTTDPNDFPLLQAEGYAKAYEEGVKTGQVTVPMPTSEFWVNALSIPSQYDKLARDFRNLLKEYGPK